MVLETSLLRTTSMTTAIGKVGLSRILVEVTATFIVGSFTRAPFRARVGSATATRRRRSFKSISISGSFHHYLVEGVPKQILVFSGVEVFVFLQKGQVVRMSLFEHVLATESR